VTPLDPLVLPADVVVIPVAALSSDMRERLVHEAGDYHVTRPRTRTVSSIVDAKTAALLERFRTPTTIVDAVMTFCSAEALDPQETLDMAFGALAALVEEGMLVSAKSGLAQPIVASLRAGMLVNSLEIIEPVHLLDDTEVYRARTQDGTAVALKIAGTAAGRSAIAALHQEAAILNRLDGVVNPRLMGTGYFGSRPFLVTAWHVGVDIHRAAADARIMPEPERRDELLGLAERVLEAYARLHSQGVVHGDVQPQNVLVGALGEVTILDYGLAAIQGADWVSVRGGIDLFQAPEIARARLAARDLPVPSALTEQYSLGALLYLLLNGGHTHSFSLQQDEMLRQVLEDPPLPFRRHGVAGLPAVEGCIRRALAKDPARRYRSADDLLGAFRAASARDRADSPKAAAVNGVRADHPREMLDTVLARLHVPGQLFGRGLQPPTASVTYGGAGLAYALLRIARSRGDEALLAQADLWSTRAVVSASKGEAFWNDELEIVPEIFGRSSLFHHASGVHCVHALVAHARGDDRTQQLAVEAFIAASEHCEKVDLAFGRAGLLLGCALLLDVLPRHLDSNSLRSLGQRLLHGIWSELEVQPPLAESTRLPTLGVAHGWSGLLFAILRWCEVSDTPAPGGFGERLEQLAALGQTDGRGMRWPRKAGAPVEDSILTASWCNGAAGHVYLWTVAHRRWGDERFDRLAHMAAWSAFDGSADAPGELCCGLAGRAYALLCRYRHGGEPQWLARAWILGERAAARPGVHEQRLHSLYHGEVGIALLAADLRKPEFACMPLFEAEGWARGAVL
jgi:hypothetical protein